MPAMSEVSSRPLRVCYFGTYRANYNRNQIMIAGLRLAGIEVVECHETLWRGIEDRSWAAAGGWLTPAFWVRLVRAYLRLLRRYRQVGAYDVLVAGYPGILDVFLARILANLRGKPLVWDVFLSIYEVACERGWQQSRPFSVRLLNWVEALALRMPHLGLLDTPFYADWFRKQYPRLHTPLDHVLIGVDERIFSTPESFSPAPAGEATLADERQEPACRVLYYGTYLPNHGIRIILEAMQLLTDHPEIQLEMVGKGVEASLAHELAAQWRLSNITFVDWLEKQELVKRILQADIILGAFGNTLHSLVTVHNKTYEGLAMGRVVLTGDSPVMRQYFHPGEDVYLCRQADPHGLAQAILTLAADPQLRKRIGENGRRHVQAHFTLHHIGASFGEILRRLVDAFER
jgi:glycosyltransferase involved in cell wall biosynthesis